MHFRLRSTAVMFALAAMASMALTSAAPAAVPSTAAPAAVSSTATSSHSIGVSLQAPKIVGEACRSQDGVTVVVDFRDLANVKGKKMNLVRIGCAEGAQASGLTALLSAGFDVDPSQPFVCTIDNRPLNPATCPPPDGFWSYSHGERGKKWQPSGVGAGDWVPPAGSLEGWSWAPYDKLERWVTPRETPKDLFPPAI